MSQYLDYDGLLYFWKAIKDKFAGKVDKVDGKGLSTNDYTTDEKTKLAGIAAGAQVNSITGVKGNSESTYRTGQVNLTAANVGAAASSHAHGNIQNGGTLQTTDVAVANGDKLVVTDSSDSAKVARTSIAFDGSTTTKALTPKGTWETFNNYSLPTASASTKGGVKIGAGLTMTGEVLSADVQEVSDMTGATSSADGAHGLVPAPAKGDQAKFLMGDGTWRNLSVGGGLSSSYIDIKLYRSTGSGGIESFSTLRLSTPTSSYAGLMSSSDKTKLDALPTNATLESTYAKKSDITSMYRHKGSVAATGNLPTTGQTEGDVYNVTATDMNYVWTGSEWDALGQVFTINSITNADIDTILAA